LGKQKLFVYVRVFVERLQITRRVLFTTLSLFCDGFKALYIVLTFVSSCPLAPTSIIMVSDSASEINKVMTALKNNHPK
jgi:hypothetical protein